MLDRGGPEALVTVHQLVAAMNVLLGNIGNTVSFVADEQPDYLSLESLKASCDAGEVETLIILDGNPVYDAPADLDWKATQRKAQNVIRLGYYVDETSQDVDWHLAHYLESWEIIVRERGSAAPGSASDRSLFGGWSEIELLARLAGDAETKGYDIARTTLEALTGAWKLRSSVETVSARWAPRSPVQASLHGCQGSGLEQADTSDWGGHHG